MVSATTRSSPSYLEGVIFIFCSNYCIIFWKWIRKQVIEALVNMYEDVSTKPEGTEYLFKVFMESKHIKDLPPRYVSRDFHEISMRFHLINAARTFRIYDNCHLTTCNGWPQRCRQSRDEKEYVSQFPQKVNFHRNFHEISVNFRENSESDRTMYTLLAMTNPFKMASSITSLFLAKPLGSRNLAQKLMETIAGLFYIYTSEIPVLKVHRDTSYSEALGTSQGKSEISIEFSVKFRVFWDNIDSRSVQGCLRMYRLVGRESLRPSRVDIHRRDFRRVTLPRHQP